MGSIYEEILRRFSELSNQESGDYYTPRDVVKLLVSVIFCEESDLTDEGLIVLVLHWVCVGIPLLGLILFKLDWRFYLSGLTWVIICGLHVYHNGCIFTRIERELWQSKDWLGPWVLPFYCLERIGISVTSGLANNIFVCWGILVIIWIILRIIFSIE